MPGLMASLKLFGHLGELLEAEFGGASTAIGYVAEDGVTQYVAENGTTNYVPESFFSFFYGAEDGVTQYVAEDGSTDYVTES